MNETEKKEFLDKYLPNTSYRPDFSFTKRGFISAEQEKYKRKVEKAIKKDTRHIISFHEKPSHDDVIRQPLCMGTQITDVYEMEQRGVILYHHFEGIIDGYFGSASLLGFNQESKEFINLKGKLEQIANEGDSKKNSVA